MIRCRLDDRGWYQFEWLVQSLLKAELGLGVQSWGGSQDHGRDAWCREALPFPAQHRPSEGPFLFQVKFIQDGNAAGAKVKKALLAAVSAEAARIRRRMLAGTSAGTRRPWRELAHYVLLTNAPLSARLRTAITNILRPVLPKAKIHPLGGTDICDMLDQHASLRRSFPQLLGLKDLEEILRGVVNKENVERRAKAVDDLVISDVEKLRKASEILRSLCEAVPSDLTLTGCREAAQELEGRVERLERDAQEIRPPEEESESEQYAKPAVDFDVEALFADLWSAVFGRGQRRNWVAPDDTRWSQHIIAVGNHIVIKVNDQVVGDYAGAKNTFRKRYLALQQHDSESVVHNKDLLMRPLPAKRQPVARRQLNCPPSQRTAIVDFENRSLASRFVGRRALHSAGLR